jgi:hypothetical protein
MIGGSNNEVNRAVEKFLNDVRSAFKLSGYIKSRQFCVKILSSIIELFKLESKKRRSLELFKWV